MTNTTVPIGSTAKRAWEGNLLALTTAICLGLNVPANKVLIPVWMSPGAQAISRIVCAAVLIWLISLFTKRTPILRQDWWKIAVSGALLFGFMYLFATAFTRASAIDISIILAFQPLMVTAIQVIFLKQRISRNKTLGLLIALGGTILVIISGSRGDGGHSRLIGDLYAVGCAVCYSVYLTLMQGPSDRYDVMKVMRWVFLVAALCCLPFIGQIRDVPCYVHPHWVPLALMAFVILFPTCYCYLATDAATRLVGSEVVALYQYLVPVVATVVSLALKLDSFEWYQPVAFGIILIGVWLYERHRKVKLST